MIGKFKVATYASRDLRGKLIVSAYSKIYSSEWPGYVPFEIEAPTGYEARKIARGLRTLRELGHELSEDAQHVYARLVVRARSGADLASSLGFSPARCAAACSELHAARALYTCTKNGHKFLTVIAMRHFLPKGE